MRVFTSWRSIRQGGSAGRCRDADRVAGQGRRAGQAGHTRSMPEGSMFWTPPSCWIVGRDGYTVEVNADPGYLVGRCSPGRHWRVPTEG